MGQNSRSIPSKILRAALLASAAFALGRAQAGPGAARKKRGKSPAARRGIAGRREDLGSDYAFVVNPSKPRARKAEEAALSFFAERRMRRPMFIETLPEKDGYACAKEALARGAGVVVACGGDGTVRTVAGALCGTGVPMGVLPIGTANLFAKNVGLPLGVPEALQVASSFGSKRVDMGSMRFLDSSDPEFRHRFLLISGIGTDADMIGLTNLSLKKYLGWGAYVLGGLKSMLNPRYFGSVSVRGEDGKTVKFGPARFRSFLVGNCGKIPLIDLMPGASYSDGILDFKLIDTRKGLLGWAELASGLFRQSKAKASEGGAALSGAFTVREARGVGADLRLRSKAPVELDGDVVARSARIEVGVEKRALVLRAPLRP